MPFIGFVPASISSAVTATNPYDGGSNCRAHIVLAHPLEPNGLILTRGEGMAYSRSQGGRLKSDGRTIAGNIKMVGSVLKESANCNFIVNLAMADQLRRLLDISAASSTPITCIDNWTTGRKKVFLSELSIGDRAWESPKPDGMFLVQFTIEEV